MFSPNEEKEDKISASSVEISLLNLQVRRLKWIIQDARNLLMHFNVNSEAFRNSLNELLISLEETIRKVDNNPEHNKNLYAFKHSIDHWNHGRDFFNTRKNKDFSQEIKCDPADQKITKFILQDIELCYQSDLKPTWVEKRQDKLYDKFETQLDSLSNSLLISDSPSCFISYAWGIPKQEKWVHKLAKQLKKIGVKVYLDIWHNQHGSIPKFMELINEADYVILIGTTNLKEKWKSENPYIVKLEIENIIFNIYGKNPKSFIKLLLDGENETSFPTSLKHYACSALDFTQEKNYFDKFFNLIEKLYENRKNNLNKIKTSRKSFFNVDIKEIKNEYHMIDEITKYLKNDHHKNGSIVRLFYKIPLPIKNNYINLKIVQESEQVKKEELLRKKEIKESKNICLEENPRIYEEMFQSASSITINDIFKETLEKESYHILITGLAGVGKTTLSQYIYYAWSCNDYEGSEIKKIEVFDDWHKKFSFVIRIPLRILMSEEYQCQEKSAIDFIVNFICSTKKSSDLTETPEIEKSSLEKQLSLEEKAGHVLLILDGYDEIAKELPSNMQNIMKKLLAGRYVILTSRPYYLDDLSSKFNFNYDKSYRVTGFTDDNICLYIRNFFLNLVQPKKESGESLYKYLKNHLSLWGPCHVPINLELVCSAWDQHPFDKDIHMTMTSLYNKVITSLCMRYLEKKKYDISLMEKQDALELCERQLQFLEHWAFIGIMQKKLVLPIKSSLSYIAEKYYPKKSNKKSKWIHKKSRFIIDLLDVGFIKSIGEGTHEPEKEYYFPHRTFQEYFAACYFSHYLENKNLEDSFSEVKKIRPEAFIQNIQKNIYDVSLEIFWWFFAGLQKPKDQNTDDQEEDKKNNDSLKIKNIDNGIDILFKYLFNKNTNLLSIHQPMLSIRCWDELQANSLSLKYNLTLKENIEFILHILIKNIRLPYIQPLLERFRMSTFVCRSNLVSDFLLKQLKDEDKEIIHQAISFIHEMIAVPENIIDIMFYKAEKYPKMAFLLFCMISKNQITYNNIKKLDNIIIHYSQEAIDQFIECITKDTWSSDIILEWLEGDEKLKKIAIALCENTDSSYFDRHLLKKVKKILKKSTSAESRLNYLILIKKMLIPSKVEGFLNLLNQEKIENFDIYQKVIFYYLMNQANGNKNSIDLTNILINFLENFSFAAKKEAGYLFRTLLSYEKIHILYLILKNKNKITLMNNAIDLYNNFYLYRRFYSYREFINITKEKLFVEELVEEKLVAERSIKTQFVLKKIISLLKKGKLQFKEGLSRLILDFPIQELEQYIPDFLDFIFKIDNHHDFFDFMRSLIKYKTLSKNNVKKLISNISSCGKIFMQEFGLNLLLEHYSTNKVDNYKIYNKISRRLILLFNGTSFLGKKYILKILNFEKNNLIKLQPLLNELLLSNTRQYNFLWLWFLFDSLLNSNKIEFSTEEEKKLLFFIHKGESYLVKFASCNVYLLKLIKIDKITNLIDKYTDVIFENNNLSGKLAWLQALSLFRKKIKINFSEKIIKSMQSMDNTLIQIYFFLLTRYLSIKEYFLNPHHIISVLDALLDDKLSNRSQLLLTTLNAPFLSHLAEMHKQYNPVDQKQNSDIDEMNTTIEGMIKTFFDYEYRFNYPIRAKGMDIFPFRYSYHQAIGLDVDLDVDLDVGIFPFVNVNHHQLLRKIDKLIFKVGSLHKLDNESFFIDFFKFISSAAISMLSKTDLSSDLLKLDFSDINDINILYFILKETSTISIIEKYLTTKDINFLYIIVLRIMQENKTIMFIDNKLYLIGKEKEELEKKLSVEKQLSFIKKMNKIFYENYIFYDNFNCKLNLDRIIYTFDVDQSDKNGWTPLMRAIFKKEVSNVKTLLESKANLNLSSSRVYKGFPVGSTAVVIAKKIEDIEIKSLLRAHINSFFHTNFSYNAMKRDNKEEKFTGKIDVKQTLDLFASRKRKQFHQQNQPTLGMEQVKEGEEKISVKKKKKLLSSALNESNQQPDPEDDDATSSNSSSSARNNNSKMNQISSKGNQASSTIYSTDGGGEESKKSEKSGLARDNPETVNLTLSDIVSRGKSTSSSYSSTLSALTSEPLGVKTSQSLSKKDKVPVKKRKKLSDQIDKPPQSNRLHREVPETQHKRVKTLSPSIL